MKLVNRLPVPALFTGALLASVLGACGGNPQSTTTAGSGASAGTSTGASGAQGGGGDGGLFPTTGAGTPGGGGPGGTGGGGTGGTTTTSTPPDPNAPCLSPDAAATSSIWAKQAGADDVQSAFGVAADTQGNVVVVGGFNGALDFGVNALNSTGLFDAFIAKLDSSGKALWAKQAGEPQRSQFTQHVATDAQNNIIATGHFRGSVNWGGSTLNDVYNFFDDLFIVKLDPNGGHLWSKRYGDLNSEESQAIATDPQGNILFVGNFQKSIDFGGGALIAEESGFNAFVAKLSANGDQQWAKSLGDAAFEQKALGVAADKDGNVYVSGYFKGTIDLGGGVQTADSGKQFPYVVKYSSNGTYVWGKTYPTDTGAAVSIAVDPAGDVYVLGNFKGSGVFDGVMFNAGVADDVFLLKLDNAGKLLFAHAYGTANKAESATALDLDGDKPVITGIFTDQIDFGGGALKSGGGFDAFVAKLDNNGCQIHANAYGGAMLQRAEAVAVDPMSNVLVVGGFDGTTDFGTGALTAAGTDVFVLKTKP